MNKTFKQELYTSPRVRIVEIKARQVLCTSPEFGTISNMYKDDEEVI